MTFRTNQVGVTADGETIPLTEQEDWTEAQCETALLESLRERDKLLTQLRDVKAQRDRAMDTAERAITDLFGFRRNEPKIYEKLLHEIRKEIAEDG